MLRSSPTLAAFALASAALVAASSAEGPVVATRLSYSTYLGGAGDDLPAVTVVGADGSVYVAGTSEGSPDLPTTQLIGNEGTVDGAFVAKFTPAGALLWCTRIGGVTNAHGLAVDSTGRAWVVGETGSGQFPAVKPSQKNAGGQGDAYVMRLAADGASAEFASYLGGSQWDVAWSVAIDSHDRAVVSGLTYSYDFPRLRATQSVFGGEADAFVARFGESGFDFSTIIGGQGIDWGLTVAVGPDDDAYVGGVARSDDFPTTLEVPRPSPGVAFLARIDLDAPRVVAATLLAAGTWDLRVRGLAVAPDGSCSFVATADGNLPPNGSGVSRPPLVDPPVSSLEGPVSFRLHKDRYNVYFESQEDREYGPLDSWLGGNSLYGKWSADGRRWDAMWGLEGDATAIARRSDGEIAIAGRGARCATPGACRYGSRDGPTAYDSGARGDAFVARLAADGKRFVYATQLGGAGDSAATSVAYDASGGIWVAGATNVSDFAVRSALQGSYAGGAHDGFLVRLAPPAAAPKPFAVQRFGDVVDLAWQDTSGGAASFEIERMASSRTGERAEFHAVPEVVATLPPGTTSWSEPFIGDVDFAYRVVAVLPSGASGGTPLRSPGFLHPASPREVTATRGGGKRVRVRWTPADKNATRYLVLDDDGQIVGRASKKGRAALVRSQVANRGWRVVAIGRGGRSLPSERVEIAR